MSGIKIGLERISEKQGADKFFSFLDLLIDMSVKWKKFLHSILCPENKKIWEKLVQEIAGPAFTLSLLITLKFSGISLSCFSCMPPLPYSYLIHNTFTFSRVKLSMLPFYF